MINTSLTSKNDKTLPFLDVLGARGWRATIGWQPHIIRVCIQNAKLLVLVLVSCKGICGALTIIVWNGSTVHMTLCFVYGLAQIPTTVIAQHYVHGFPWCLIEFTWEILGMADRQRCGAGEQLLREVEHSGRVLAFDCNACTKSRYKSDSISRLEPCERERDGLSCFLQGGRYVACKITDRYRRQAQSVFVRSVLH